MPSPTGSDSATSADEVVPLMGAVRAVAAAVLRLRQEDPDVQDCTSETMRRAMEGRSRLRAGEQMRPWVLGIARHVALDMLRAQKRHGLVSDVMFTSEGDEGVSRTETIPDPSAGPEELLAQARRRDRIQSAMSALPEPMAIALMKFHLDGRSYQEIAEELKVPLGTVATWVTRGRKTLAERLGQKEKLT
ncbi:MAG TPA: RNA polymerase sigma factor [Polyangiaceae bacterium]|nr:RNA polymerase sigma factor [Polyangiaceae bacterium]